MMMGRDKKKVAMLILGGLKKKESDDHEHADFVDKGDDSGFSPKEGFEKMEEKHEEKDMEQHGHMAAMEDFMSAVTGGDPKAAMKAFQNLMDMGSSHNPDDKEDYS